MNDGVALAHSRLLLGNGSVVHQIAEIHRVLSRWAENYDVSTGIGFFISQKRNELANLRSRFPGASKQEIAGPQPLALSRHLWRNEGMEFTNVIVVVSVDFAIANTVQPVVDNVVLLDPLALRKGAYLPQPLHLPLPAEAWQSLLASEELLHGGLSPPHHLLEVLVHEIGRAHV